MTALRTPSAPSLPHQCPLCLAGLIPTDRARRRTRAIPLLLAAGAGTGLGLVLGAAWLSLSPMVLEPVWLATAIGRLSAVSGTYGMLWMILLVARVPLIQRCLGHDRLVAIHKTVAPWSIWLIVLHIIFSVLASSLPTAAGWWATLWDLTRTVPWVLAADAAAVLLIAAAITSIRRVRGRLRREAWWTIHLLLYLSVILAFAHQLTLDGPFLSGWVRWLWIGYYVLVAWMVLRYRVVLPLARSWRHELRVERVVPEARGVTSVWIGGRHLDRLGIEAGQFANWRFAVDRLIYEAHPYSFSARPHHDRLRITVKSTGDSSRLLPGLAPGTRVLMEGPYGAITARSLCTTGRAVLVAGGVGVSPVRALAEEITDLGGRVVVLLRASTPHEAALLDELRDLAARPNMRLHELIGPRTEHRLDPDQLRRLVPEIAACEVYACGPPAMVRQVLASARALGVGDRHLHTEDFSM